MQMTRIFFLYLWLLICLHLTVFTSVCADETDSQITSALQDVPTSHQGRFRPLFSSIEKIPLQLVWKELLEGDGRLPKNPLSPVPLRESLLTTGETFKVLPGRYIPGEWYSLRSFSLQTYNPLTEAFEPIGNFTLYPDEHFRGMQSTFLTLQTLPPSHPLFGPLSLQLIAGLKKGYESIALTPYAQGATQSLFYPPLWKIRWERIFLQVPWVQWMFSLYFLSFFCWTSTYFFNHNFWRNGGILFLLLAFVLHSSFLAMRIMILERPPVSNMEETLLYVPWLTVLVGIFFALFYKTPLLLAVSACASTLLLGVFSFSYQAPLLENVQPVLNSQYWLTVHVLMVVGSYAFFLLAGILGHLYLLISNKKTATLSSQFFLSKFILQLLYMGTALLICGTILGGVWAAQSWGRFWDWDPKESWAFISSCTYLLLIHAWRFGRIGPWGLAMGSLLGWQVIFFTWYGVNYLLGTGLHSYGFGSGGIAYYLTFVVSEFAFSFIMLWIRIGCDFEKIKNFFLGFLEKKSSIS